MSKTPLKLNDSLIYYTPKELITPNKDNTEVSKTIFMHVSSLHNLLSDWVKLIVKGTKICKTISALKLHEYKEDYYPHQITDLTESLLEAFDGLKNIVEGVDIINNQLKTLVQLQPVGIPVIFTWTASQIYENVSKILSCIQKEYLLKGLVLENIAHCRDENLMEVYVSAWEFDVYFKIESSDYLFAETGLPGIT